MLASTGGLQMAFRCDGDFLDGMLATTNLDGAFVAPPSDPRVIELITEALFRALQENLKRDPCCHARNLWAAAGNSTQAVIRLHARTRLRGRQSARA